MTNQKVQKFLIISGLFACTISDGYIIGQTSGMVAGLQAKDSDVTLSENEISWIASAASMTTVVGMMLAAVVSEKLSRRKALTVLTLPVIFCWIAIYFGQCMWIFMVAKVILGVCFGGVLSLCVLSTAEYTVPDVRGFYLNMVVTAGSAIGIAISNILGTLIHWRTVTILGVIPATISCLLPLIWVESPTWLASKGRFRECAEAFKILHGTGKAATLELKLLIKVETEKQKQSGRTSQSKSLVLKKISNAVKQKYMWTIARLCFVLHVYRVATGKILICAFAMTILENITGSLDIFVYSLVINGCLVLGSFLSCMFIDKMKVRTLLFTGGITANIILVALSFSLYLFRNPWLNCGLLALYTVTVNSGPSPILESLFGEIYPSEIKCYCLFGFGIIGSAMLFLSLQLALTMFSVMGYHGVFMLNAGLSFICLGYLCVFLPETKGRTLQEIELYFKNNKFSDITDLLKQDQQLSRLVST